MRIPFLAHVFPTALGRDWMVFVPGTGCGGALQRTALGAGDDGGADEDAAGRR